MDTAQLALTNGDSAVQPVPPSSNAEQWLNAAGSAVQPAHVAPIHVAHSCPRCGLNLQPIVEVAFENSMWWSLPADISYDLFDAALRGDEARYTWHNRSYKIDFETMEQENTENGRRRSVRLLWLEASNVEANWRYISLKLEESNA